MASTSSDCSDTFESNEAGSSKDLLNLPDDLPTLKKIIQQKDNNLNLAGQFGKQLLESNTELSQELENVRNQARSKMEKVEQEIYELQSKVQRNKMMEESYQDEIESLKSQIDRVREETEVMCDTRQQRAERDLKKHIATLEDDIETCRLAERQAKERSVQLQDTLDDVRTQLDDRLQTLNQTCSEEMAALNLENNTLRNDNASLSEELHNANAQLEKLHLQISKSVRNFESQDEQIEQLQCQNTSYFNALEKSRLQVQELNLQLDTLMMEKQQHNKKGNSLFSEVEDRRVAAEKELCMLKGKVQLLEEQYGESKKHILTLKFQIAGLLQISSGRVEEEHVMWLQNELSRSQYEIKKLSQKLQDSDSSQSNKAVLEKVFHHGWEDYADYVNNLLGEKDAEIKKIKDELSTKRMYLSAETMRVHEIESNLYRTKKQLNEVSAKCEKRRLTIEELRLKYEPDKVTHKTEKRHIVVEQIPMPASSVENKENIHGANSNLSTVDQLLTTASAEDNMFIDDNLRTLIKANQERAAARKKESRPTKKTVTLSDNVDVIPEAELCDDVSNLTDQSMDQIASAAGKRAPKGKRCYDGKDTLIVDENAENVAQCKQS